MRPFLLTYFIFSALTGSAQFSPAVGKIGSNALRYDSSCFVAWAKACKIQRGYMDISKPDSGFAKVGDSVSATGPALDKGVVSLGDGGSATVSFSNPIKDGAGWDFAVFENTFLDTFLELAFVEVSSDGNRFVRFPSESLTDTSKQTGAFGYTYPEKVNNLAGKYVVGFGTPFDLQELKDSAGLDILKIKFVRIVDVVGSINPKYASRDSKGRKVNDPWPTLFPSSGFDLDAVGVIYENLSAKTYNISHESPIKLWPNPLNTNQLHVQVLSDGLLKMFNLLGEEVESLFIQKGSSNLDISVPPGMYMVQFHNDVNGSIISQYLMIK